MRKLSSFGIASLHFLTAFVAGPCLGAISDTSPSNGETVTVSTDAPNPATTGISSSANNVTINILKGAGIDYAGSYAIDGDSNWSINNSGTIAASHSYAVNLNGPGVVTNTGKIQAPAYPIYITGVADVTNADTIAATGSYAAAVYFDGTHDDHLTLMVGSTIVGFVDADLGTDTLTLGGDRGSDTFNVSKIGSVALYRGFEVFKKEGDSTWTLTGSGTQDWTVSGGTLIGKTHSLQGDIINNAKVVFDDAGFATYPGVMSGTGSLVKKGGGQLTLTGHNTYSGGTIVNAGILKGDTDSLQGDITNNSKIYFKQTPNGTYAGDMSGTGSLTKFGAGTLTLSGTNTYTGGTTVWAGRLTLGGDNVLPDNGDVNVLSGAVLKLAGHNATIGSLDAEGDVILDSGDLVISSGYISGAISGSGSLTTAGLLILNGTNTYTGGTIVTNGATLNVKSSVGSVRMVNGGTLLGSGVVDALVINGGQFDLGDISIGTRNVTHDFTLDSGATMVAKIRGDGASDLMKVGGQATLARGSTIEVHVTSVGSYPNIHDGDQWTIITADGGVTDKGAVVTDDFARFSFTGGVSGDNYLLTAVRQVLTTGLSVYTALAGDHWINADLDEFFDKLSNVSDAQFEQALMASTAQNVGATQVMQLRTTQRFHHTLGGYLQGRRTGTPGLGASEMQAADGQPSGVQLASAAHDPRTLGLFLAQAENKTDGWASTPRWGSAGPDRAQGSVDSRLGGFGVAYGVYNDREASGNTLGAKSRTYAGQVGLDYAIDEHWLAGLSFSYARGNINFAMGRGGNQVDTYRVGPYAGYENGPWFADASLTYGLHRNDLTRRVPATDDEFTAHYNTQDIAAYIGGGYVLEANDWRITPEASVQYVHTWTDSYDESGGGGALDVDGAQFGSLRSTLGVNMSRRFDAAGMTFVPHVGAGWAHEFLNNQEDLSARFIGGITPFLITTGGGDTDSVFYSAGLTALLRDDISLDLTYRGETFAHEQTHALMGSVTIAF